MTNDTADSDRDPLGHVLLPVAHEGDARKTAVASEPYAPDRATALHVVEKIVRGSLVIDAINALETPVLLTERPSTRSLRERLFGR